MSPTHPSPERAFWKSLKAREFVGAYCIYGEDDFLKERAVKDLVGAAVEEGTRDFNLDVRQGGELDAETLGTLLSTPPMMAERRVVVVRDAAALKKEAKGWLDGYLERTSERGGSADVVLVLVYASGEKGKPDKNVLARTLAVDFAPLSWDRLPKWIAHHASTELGVSVTDAAAELLQQAVGNDLSALAAELDKLASYTRGEEIDESAVTAVVGVRRGETLADFLDLVARRDAAGALALVPHILTQPKANGVTVVMALTTQTLALAWGEAAIARGLAPGRLQGEYFNFLKSGGGPYTGRPWGDAVRAWSARAAEWDVESLDAALHALLAADIALKDTRVSSDEQTLATLVLALCAGASRGPGRRGNGRGSRGGARRAAA
ncbi:MAG TPA: DNA polymerase III subunit delta [Gemmatimonadaceae bacterium]|nr:DNA polymerase III subunit delta [Gemmatimonadaceae bacterium]